MDQVIEVSTREEQIAGVVQLFEDRLTSPKPEAGSWAELSAMLNGASAWRDELSRRWASREDWKRFLEWEKRRAAEKKQIQIRVGHWMAIVKELDQNRIEVIWSNPRGTFTRGTAELKSFGRWFWTDEYNASELHQDVPPQGLHAVCAAARAWFDGPQQAAAAGCGKED